MAKNILTIPLLELQQHLPHLKNVQLKNLIEGIYEFKWNNRKLDIESVKDIERKESMIEREMQTRTYLNPKLYEQYYIWKRSLNFRKRYF